LIQERKAKIKGEQNELGKKVKQTHTHTHTENAGTFFPVRILFKLVRINYMYCKTTGLFVVFFIVNFASSGVN